MKQWSFLIARHWETESNITWAIVGITDVNLTQKWLQEAHILWKNITKEVDLIITSPQKRAIVSCDIIRKYINVPIIEHPILHPQNFWEIEWMTLEEARNNWLWNFLHKEDTNKYLHTGKNWESAKEMESRTIPEIMKLLDICNEKTLNILLMTHNSILRCLIGNINNLDPSIWIENNLSNWEIFNLTSNSINRLNINNITWSIEELIEHLFKATNLSEYQILLNDFSRLSIHEELEVINYLKKIFHWNNNTLINQLINLLNNTIILNQLFSEIKEICNVKWIYTVLQFWSSIYWKNYSINDYTDLDIEIIIDDNFDINSEKHLI